MPIPALEAVKIIVVVLGMVNVELKNTIPQEKLTSSMKGNN